jgi:hypothetical protein
MSAALAYPDTVRAALGLAVDWQSQSLMVLFYGVGRWRGQRPVAEILKQ